ncbi:MAG: hypothetical protein ACP5G4_01175 [bacterium]
MAKPNPLIIFANKGSQSNFIARFFKNAREWAEGRLPFIRLALLLFFAYIWFRHQNDWLYNSIFKGLNLGIHELGHFLFQPFGKFLFVAGGTIAQCGAPIIGMAMFARQRDYFGIAVAFGWLSTNFYDVATYSADARMRELPLVSPFGMEAQHDWTYLLGELNLLARDQAVGIFFRRLGWGSMLICLLFGAWLVFHMFRTMSTDKIGEYVEGE